MVQMKLTVIIPVYNSENTIGKCIKSMEPELHPDVEYILVNDGSIDDSHKICEAFALQYRNIIVLNTTNCGVSHARNIGMKAGTAEYFMFVDSDDYLDSNSITQCLDVLEHQKCDLLCFGCVSDYQTKDRTLYKQERREIRFPGVKTDVYEEFSVNGDFIWLFENNIFDSVWGKIYKKSIILDNGITFTERMTIREDSEFVVHYTQFISYIGVLDRYYYHYCISGNELSYYLRREIHCEDIEKLMNRYDAFFLHYRIETAKAKELVYRHIFLLVMAGIVYNAAQKSHKSFRSLYLYIQSAGTMLADKYSFLAYRGFYALTALLMKHGFYLLCAIICKVRFYYVL